MSISSREFKASLAVCEDLLRYSWDDPRMVAAMRDIMNRIGELPAIAERIRAERAVKAAAAALDQAMQRLEDAGGCPP